MSSRNSASDTVDVRFLLEGRGELDVPHLRWIIHNQDQLTRRMPLSAFLKLLPAWLLKDVEASSIKAQAAMTDVEHAERASALALSLLHLSLRSEEPGGAVRLRLEAIAECVDSFRVACALEFQRRCGVLRIHYAQGEDRLDNGDQRLALELNPLVVEALKKRDAPPSLGSREFKSLLAEIMPEVLKSDWAEPQALAD